MGPAATVAFYDRLVKRTLAETDQDHLHVLIDGNAEIPDRTESIQAGSRATLEALMDSAKRLERIGAELLAMPCNSAHYWYDEVAAAIGIPFLNMPAEVFARAKRRGLSSLGLLATSATARAGVYSRYAGSTRLILPPDAAQEQVHAAIYRVKSGGAESEDAKAELLSVADELRRRGAAGIILGCTEIPLVVGPEDLPELAVLDSTEILVDAVLREALPSAVSGEAPSKGPAPPPPAGR